MAKMHCICTLGRRVSRSPSATHVISPSCNPYIPLLSSLIFIDYFFCATTSILMSSRFSPDLVADGGGIHPCLHQLRSSLPQYELWVVHPGPRLRVHVSSHDVISRFVDQHNGHMSCQLLAMDAGRLSVHWITGVLLISTHCTHSNQACDNSYALFHMTMLLAALFLMKSYTLWTRICSPVQFLA